MRQLRSGTQLSEMSSMVPARTTETTAASCTLAEKRREGVEDGGAGVDSAGRGRGLGFDGGLLKIEEEAERITVRWSSWLRGIARCPAVQEVEEGGSYWAWRQATWGVVDWAFILFYF